MILAIPGRKCLSCAHLRRSWLTTSIIAEDLFTRMTDPASLKYSTRCHRQLIKQMEAMWILPKISRGVEEKPRRASFSQNRPGDRIGQGFCHSSSCCNCCFCSFSAQGRATLESTGSLSTFCGFPLQREHHGSAEGQGDRRAHSTQWHERRVRETT